MRRETGGDTRNIGMKETRKDKRDVARQFDIRIWRNTISEIIDSTRERSLWTNMITNTAWHSGISVAEMIVRK